MARTKTLIDETGKKLGEQYRVSLDAILADRKEARDSLDALKDEVSKPVTEFRQREKDRIARHEADIAVLQVAADLGLEPSIESIKTRIATVESVDTSAMQEFERRGALVKSDALQSLRTQLAAAEQREAERAELERHRKEAAVRAQVEHEVNIARLAREAAEEKAERERHARDLQLKADAEARERKEREARERLEREKQEAEQRAAKAEADRLAQIERAKQDAINAAWRAEEARKAAELRAKQEQEAAIERERDRVAAEEEAKREEQAAREADREHRRTVNSAVLKALMAEGLPHDMAVIVIQAIVGGKISNVTLQY